MSMNDFYQSKEYMSSVSAESKYWGKLKYT